MEDDLDHEDMCEMCGGPIVLAEFAHDWDHVSAALICAKCVEAITEDVPEDERPTRTRRSS
jgi:hypothetical protein